MTNYTAFPDHDVDPRKKGDLWILQYAKAAWNEWHMGMLEGSIFMAKRIRNEEILKYAMANQDTAPYKLEMLPEDSQEDAFLKISWEVPANLMVLRNIAVAKLQKEGYNILCTPINQQAKDAQDEEYAKARIKIMMREAMQQHAPQLADSPLVKKAPGEADDLEELKMELDSNPKFVRATEAEESIQLVFYENDVQQIWDVAAENFVDLGAAIVKVGGNENNKIILRNVDQNKFICSYTEKADFSDLTWAGEVKQVSLSDLSKKLDSDKLDKIKTYYAGRNGNSSSMQYNVGNNGYDPFKCPVLDLEFISYNKMVTQEGKYPNGNIRVSKTKPSDEGKQSLTDTYITKTIEVVYKCKWVVDTDIIYDYGLAENIPRTVNISTMGKTNLSYIIMAASFHKMTVKGLTENMISFEDDLCMATYKLRNLRNEMIGGGLDIDIAALESVALGKGGSNLTSFELLDLLKQKKILLSRRSGTALDSNINYKAVQAFSTNEIEQMTGYLNDIANSKQGLRDVSGLNELTDGSTPNARMLTTTANLANESTNNALWYLINPRKKLIEKTAKSTIQMLQVAIKRGPYDGYNPHLGKWITVPKSIADFDYDIMTEDKATDDQKSILYTMMQDDIRQGFLDSSDAITIINTYNIKRAQLVLAYRVKCNKKKMQDASMQNTNATANAQMQSNQQAEIMKDKMADKQLQRTLTIENNAKAWDFAIAEVKAGHENARVAAKVGADLLMTAATTEAAQQPAQQPQQQEQQEAPMQ